MRFLYMVFVVSVAFCGDVTVGVDSHQINEGESIILTVKSENSKDFSGSAIDNFKKKRDPLI